MAKDTKKADAKSADAKPDAFVPPPRPELPSKDGRTHKATYAKDRKEGGYNLRVIGPHAKKMGRRWLPVTRFDGSENMEYALDIIWSGTDDGTEDRPGTGLPVALFSMWKAPKEEQDEIPF